MWSRLRAAKRPHPGPLPPAALARSCSMTSRCPSTGSAAPHAPEDHVPERTREQGGAARETTDDGSRHASVFAVAFRGATPLGIGIAAGALVAAVLLVVTEFSTVASVDVAN